ncbi:MAG: hypothetical protein WA797_02050 [Acidimicrobiales bacterium]
MSIKPGQLHSTTRRSHAKCVAAKAELLAAALRWGDNRPYAEIPA